MSYLDQSQAEQSVQSILQSSQEPTTSRKQPSRRSKSVPSKNTKDVQTVKGKFYLLYETYFEQSIKRTIQGRVKTHTKQKSTVEGWSKEGLTIIQVTFFNSNHQQPVPTLPAFFTFDKISPPEVSKNAKPFIASINDWTWPESKSKSIMKYITGQRGLDEHIKLYPHDASKSSALMKGKHDYAAAQKTIHVEKHKVRGIFIMGQANAGKSTFAQQLATHWAVKNNWDYKNGLPYYVRDRNSKYFQGVGTQPVIIYDDADQSMPAQVVSKLKDLVNIFPCNAEIKGSGSFLFPDLVIITSQYSLHSICKKDPPLQQALRARFIFLSVRCVTSSYEEIDGSLITVPTENANYYVDIMKNSDLQAKVYQPNKALVFPPWSEDQLKFPRW